MSELQEKIVRAMAEFFAELREEGFVFDHYANESCEVEGGFSLLELADVVIEVINE